MWERRAAQGSLGEGKPGGTTALISLGSDGPPLVPLGQNTPHTLSAARYESGLDNSPQCKPQQPRVSPSLSRRIVHADDGPPNGNEGFGLGPLTFNGSTHGVAGNGMMELYLTPPNMSLHPATFRSADLSCGAGTMWRSPPTTHSTADRCWR